MILQLAESRSAVTQILPLAEKSPQKRVLVLRSWIRSYIQSCRLQQHKVKCIYKRTTSVLTFRFIDTRMYTLPASHIWVKGKQHTAADQVHRFNPMPPERWNVEDVSRLQNSLKWIGILDIREQRSLFWVPFHPLAIINLARIWVSGVLRVWVQRSKISGSKHYNTLGPPQLT